MNFFSFICVGLVTGIGLGAANDAISKIKFNQVKPSIVEVIIDSHDRQITRYSNGTEVVCPEGAPCFSRF